VAYITRRTDDLTGKLKMGKFLYGILRIAPTVSFYSLTDLFN